MKKDFRWFAVLSICLVDSGCALFPGKNPDHVEPSLVINTVKDELNFFSYYITEHPLSLPAARTAFCSSGTGAPILVKPSKAKVGLKVVATQEQDPSIGLASPIGVLSIDPSYSGAYSKSNTQSLQFEFPLDSPGSGGNRTPPKSTDIKDHPITNAVYGALVQMTKVDHNISPCFRDPTLALVVTFDVVNKRTIGSNITLVIFKLGDKVTVSDEFHQTLEFDFNVPGTLLR
jgi:hypothetical protein